jgi:hypothetical protein
MREAQNINFSISSMNEESKGKPVRKYVQPAKTNLNFANMVEFIKGKKFPKKTEDKLISVLKKTPHGSYDNFRKNYKNYLK